MNFHRTTYVLQSLNSIIIRYCDSQKNCSVCGCQSLSIRSSSFPWSTHRLNSVQRHHNHIVHYLCTLVSGFQRLNHYFYGQKLQIKRRYRLLGLLKKSLDEMSPRTRFDIYLNYYMLMKNQQVAITLREPFIQQNLYKLLGE